MVTFGRSMVLVERQLVAVPIAVAPSALVTACV
jgi:hypothetical protein